MNALFEAAYDVAYIFFEWCASLLHICPFEDLIPVLKGMETGLGWLNWFIPVYNIVQILEVWAGALALFYVMKEVIDTVRGKME